MVFVPLHWHHAKNKESLHEPLQVVVIEGWWQLASSSGAGVWGMGQLHDPCCKDHNFEEVLSVGKDFPITKNAPGEKGKKAHK